MPRKSDNWSVIREARTGEFRGLKSGSSRKEVSPKSGGAKEVWIVKRDSVSGRYVTSSKSREVLDKTKRALDGALKRLADK